MQSGSNLYEQTINTATEQRQPDRTFQEKATDPIAFMLYMAVGAIICFIALAFMGLMGDSKQ